MIKSNLKRSLILLLPGIFLSFAFIQIQDEAAKWEYLLDNNLSQWDKFIGVPHHSLDLEGYEKGDGMKGTPIGLNKDPLNVFQVREEEGSPVLFASGQIYGGLSTKKEYQNYHLQLKFKFGEKKYAPRLKKKRDSGLLYHCQKPHGQFWNVWMRSQELQIQETDVGDFYALAGVSMDIRATEREENGNKFWFYDPKGEKKTFKSRCRRSANFEHSHGEWSTVDLICLGTTAYHIVNGKVVMVLENSQQYINGKGVLLDKGKIQLQSEGAEVYYKDIKIKSIKKLPRKIRKQL